MAINTKKREQIKRDRGAEIADEFIKAIEAGTAPWQQPWREGVLGGHVHNPISKTNYKGINALYLDLIMHKRGYEDPRWMTFKQAMEKEAFVKKGEKSTSVELWRWSEDRLLKDKEGNPILDENGDKQYQHIRFDRPRISYFNVFNAEQIDGLEAYQAPLLPVGFEPHSEAEKIMQSMQTDTKVTIKHGGDRAFYRPSSHLVQLPEKAAFKSMGEYYAVALHELGHSTGHKDLLARTMSGGFGSPDYAKEELRAEMSSYMVAKELGLAHDPSRHAGYVENWLKVLRDDKNEIFRAARDAEKIKQFILEPEARPELIRQAQQATQSMTPAQAIPKQEVQTMSDEKKHYVNVPYEERHDAKRAGARWDKEAKSWYFIGDEIPETGQKWLAQEEKPKHPPVEVQFATALKEAGLIVKDTPIMDGKWHRVAVDGDKGVQSGSYRAFMDGVPNGQITNFKTSDKPQRWVAKMNLETKAQDHAQDPVDLKASEAEQAQIKAMREAELKAMRIKAIRNANGLWNHGKLADPNHSYLSKKAIMPHDLRQTQDGKLMIPLRDQKGTIKNLQMIDQEGQKRFLKGGEKQGYYHLIGEVQKPLDYIIIAEGYATAASLHEATKRPVAVAFDAGNLAAVSQSIRAAYPHNPIVIGADQDQMKERNVGIDKAFEAMRSTKGVRIIAPEFSESELKAGHSDYNDYMKLRGKEALADAVAKDLKYPIPWEMEQRELLESKAKEKPAKAEPEKPMEQPARTAQKRTIRTSKKPEMADELVM